MQLPILCKLIRPGGTRVDIDGIEYHFAPHNDPNGLGRHVAIVEHKAHIARFLSITEGYEVCDDGAPAPPIPAPAPAVNVRGPAQPGPNPAAAPVALKEPPETLGEAIAQNPGLGSFSAPEPNVQTEAVGAVATSPTPADVIPAPTGPLPTEAEMETWDITPLRAQFLKEVGRKPSPAAKSPLLISQIVAARG